MRAEYAALAADYDRRWVRYLDASLALLRPPLSSTPPARLLDLACGTGALRERLRRWGVEAEGYVGLDQSPEMLRLAAGRTGGGCVCGDAARLPFASSTFDTVVCASALHHFADAAAVLAEARRVLAPGGQLLLVDWAGDTLPIRLMAAWLRLRGCAVHRAWSAVEVAQLLRSAGFTVQRLGKGRAPPLWRLFLIEARA